MNSYRYKAVHPDGRIVKGTFRAATKSDLESEFERQGLVLVSASLRSGLFGFRRLARRPRSRLLIEFYHRLAQAIEIGIPIVSGLNEIGRSLPSHRLREIVGELQSALEKGNSLQEALSRYREIFQPVDVAIVGMGEKTGRLPQCLKELAEYYEWREGLRAVFTKALLYPAFILAVISAVIGVWIGYVLPQMAAVLKELGVILPQATIWLISASGFVQRYWPVLLGAVLAAGCAVLLFRKIGALRIATDRWLLQFPVIGPIAHKVCLARLCRNFATMLEAGMNLSAIFSTIARNTLGNRYLEGRLQEVQREVERGESLSGAFERFGDFPRLLIGALQNGESTGTIDIAFRRMGDYYNREVERGVHMLLTFIEPAAIVSLGGVFGLIVLSIFLPLYDVLGQVGNSF